MWLAPVATRFREKKQQEYVNSMEDWQSFSSFTKSRYNVDMGGLNLPFDEEQKKYYLQVLGTIAPVCHSLLLSLLQFSVPYFFRLPSHLLILLPKFFLLLSQQPLALNTLPFHLLADIHVVQSVP
jgi:hypothetical protein